MEHPNNLLIHDQVAEQMGDGDSPTGLIVTSRTPLLFNGMDIRGLFRENRPTEFTHVENNVVIFFSESRWKFKINTESILQTKEIRFKSTDDLALYTGGWYSKELNWDALIPSPLYITIVSKECSSVASLIDIPVVIIQHHIIIFANYAAYTTFKQSRLIGKSVSILMPNDVASIHHSFIEQYENTGKGNVIGTEGRRVLAQDKDGNRFPVLLSIFAANKKGCYVGIMHPLSSDDQKEEDKLAMLASQHSFASMKQWTRLIFHEANNSLAAITCNLAAFMKTTLEDTPVILSSIQNSCSRLGTLLNESLSRLKISADGSLVLHCENTNMYTFMEDLHETVNLQLRDQNISMDIVGTGTSCVDINRIYQVFLNLISNSIKAKFQHESLIRIRLVPQKDNLTIFYEDNCCGIHADKHDSIFDNMEDVIRILMVMVLVCQYLETIFEHMDKVAT